MHRVAVVGQNRIDEILADVVHVAKDGREHDRTFGRAFLLLQELFEVRDRLLHHFRGLQHERQNQLARSEFVADFFHRGQQDLVEHGDRIAFFQRGIDLCLDAVLAASQDRIVNLLRHRELGIAVDLLVRRR